MLEAGAGAAGPVAGYRRERVTWVAFAVRLAFARSISRGDVSFQPSPFGPSRVVNPSWRRWGWATIYRMDEGAAEDPRLAFVYEEALRGLLQQQSAVESLHNRAATLVFAASFASSLLGSRALADGVGGWDWLAISLLLAIGALTVALLWPYYNLTFRFDPQDLLDTYVDSDEPVSMDDMHRRLALRIKADWQRNGRIVHRLRELFQIALIILLAEIMAWMLSIAGV
jgi:hypothetical protein